MILGLFGKTLRAGGATGGKWIRGEILCYTDGEGVFQTPAAGGDCSGDGRADGSGPVDVVGTGAGGGGAGDTTGGIVVVEKRSATRWGSLLLVISKLPRH